MAILNNQRVHGLAYHGSSIPIGASWKRSFWCTWMVTSPGRSEAPWNFRWKTLNIWTCSGKSVKTILFWKGLILVFKRLMIQKIGWFGIAMGEMMGAEPVTPVYQFRTSRYLTSEGWTGNRLWALLESIVKPTPLGFKTGWNKTIKYQKVGF